MGVLLKCFGLAVGGGPDGKDTIFREAESDFLFVFDWVYFCLSTEWMY